MIDIPNTKKDFYQSQTHEQLVIFLMNSDIREERLRKKLFLLTGCGVFGDMDGMSGSCLDCHIENNSQWERCRAFAAMEKKNKTN